MLFRTIAATAVAGAFVVALPVAFPAAAPLQAAVPVAMSTFTIDAAHSNMMFKVKHLGISTVYQEVNVCGNLTVAENIMLGREPRWGGAIDWRATRSAAATHLAALNLNIDPRSSAS